MVKTPSSAWTRRKAARARCASRGATKTGYVFIWGRATSSSRASALPQPRCHGCSTDFYADARRVCRPRAFVQGSRLLVWSEPMRSGVSHRSVQVACLALCDFMVPQQTKGRVLVVDDCDDVRLMWRRILSSAGYDVIEAQDGGEGIRQAEINEPDVILMDLWMPGIDGITA